MRPDFLEPRGELNASVVFDVMGLVSEKIPPLEVIEKWTKMEWLLAYDWAMREHLAASDNIIKRRQRPWFTTVQTEDISILIAKMKGPQWLGHDFKNELNDEDRCQVETDEQTIDSLWTGASCAKPRAVHGPRPSGDDR